MRSRSLPFSLMSSVSGLFGFVFFSGGMRGREGEEWTLDILVLRKPKWCGQEK